MSHDWAPVHYSYFPQWLKDRSYLKDRQDNESDDRCRLFPHQHFLRRFFGDSNSPYRGILLYHDTGTGKTITSISVAESLSDKHDIVVMLPAFLKANYIGEITKCGKLPSEKYTFLHYNGMTNNTIRNLGGPEFFNDKVVIIDEVHTFISYVKNEKVVKTFLYDILFRAKNIKIICLSGTPIQNEVEEVAVLANLLRGPITYHLLYGVVESMSQLTAFLEEHPRVDEYKIDTAMNKLSIVFTPEGFQKLSLQSVPKNKQTLVSQQEPVGGQSDKDIIQEIKQFFVNKRVTIEPVSKTLFPTNLDEFTNLFVDKENVSIINTTLLEKRLQGLVSFYENESLDLFPRMDSINIVNVALSPTALEQYKVVREFERAGERRNMMKLMSKKSNIKANDQKPNNSYKSFSRAICLYAFPEGIERVYKSTLPKIEDGVDRNGLLRNEKIVMMKKLKDNSDKYLTGAGLKTHGPKYSAFLERMSVSKGPVLAYSHFREIEGLGIMQLVLQAHGYAKFDTLADKSPKYGVLEDHRGRNTSLLDAFNSEENKYGEVIKVLLISQRGADGISLRNVRQVHILEPYWNPIRNKQVMGRALRINSHSTLPEEHRDVRIYLYISTLGGQELKEDNDMTSDEIVFSIAQRKSKLIDKMQDIMKKSSLDCPLYRTDCVSHDTVQKFAYSQDDVQTDVRAFKSGQSLAVRVYKNVNDPDKKLYTLRNTGEIIDAGIWLKEKIIRGTGRFV